MAAFTSLRFCLVSKTLLCHAEKHYLHSRKQLRYSSVRARHAVRSADGGVVYAFAEPVGVNNSFADLAAFRGSRATILTAKFSYRLAEITTAGAGIL